MITLIHGEDTQASRNYFFELKKQTPDPKLLEGASILSIDLQQAVEGTDLFGTTPVLFIDELFSKRKSQKEIETLAEILSNSSANITLWESKELTSKQVGQLKKAQIKLFKIPSTIFALLDALQPGNGKKLIELFHVTLKDKDGEFVLVMLQRQVRILLALQEKSDQQISELSRMAPWQQGKLSKQAKLFTSKQLIDMHTKLFELEKNMKTGGLSLPLEDSIDMFFLSL